MQMRKFLLTALIASSLNLSPRAMEAPCSIAAEEAKDSLSIAIQSLPFDQWSDKQEEYVKSCMASLNYSDLTGAFKDWLTSPPSRHLKSWYEDVLEQKQPNYAGILLTLSAKK